MSEVQFLFLALVALVVTVLTVKLIPRARQSRWFDRVLFGATWLLAFVCAWYATDQIKTEAPLATIGLDGFVRAAGVPVAIGALGGALALNLVLWLMDRVMPITAEELGADDEHADDVPTQSSES
jgi:hypothetical protein